MRKINKTVGKITSEISLRKVHLNSAESSFHQKKKESAHHRSTDLFAQAIKIPYTCLEATPPCKSCFRSLSSTR